MASPAGDMNATPAYASQKEGSESPRKPVRHQKQDSSPQGCWQFRPAATGFLSAGPLQRPTLAWKHTWSPAEGAAGVRAGEETASSPRGLRLAQGLGRGHRPLRAIQESPLQRAALPLTCPARPPLP